MASNASTLLLDQSTWDLTLNAQGDIAVANPPYSTAQDAASAIMTRLGECYFDTLIGVPWLQQILGQRPSLALLKAQLAAAAETVPDVVPGSAVVYIGSFTARGITGQVQVTSQTTQTGATASFSVINPQGSG
jgi:hypothetical protein